MTTLDENIAGSLVSVRFFNGRLLTGTDLTREQQALYARDNRIAQALGAGVVEGLDVTVASPLHAGIPAVQVTAGVGINPGGSVLELGTTTIVELSVATPPADPPRTDWRRCDVEVSDAVTTVTGSERGLFVLVLRCDPTDSTTLARVLQADRANDPCAIDHVKEGVRFRLVRMNALEGAVAALGATATDARLQNIVAHACFGTATVPAESASDAATADRAIAALYAAGELDDCDLPLAVVCIQASSNLRWVDAWAARRRLVPPLLHTEHTRATSPRSGAEAEARLLQFHAQVGALALPVVSEANRFVGTAKDTLRYLPPAGSLPAGWLATNAWRAFFGARMAPPRPTYCDAALLPSLLTNAAAEAAVPTESSTPTFPAIDVFVGGPEGAATGQVLAFARATDGRALVTVSGLTSAVIAAGVQVRFVSADGLRAWDAVRLDEVYSPAPSPRLDQWLSPNLPPGDYVVGLVSDDVTAVPVPVSIVGGRVNALTMTATVLVGTLLITLEGLAKVTPTGVTATRSGYADRAATGSGASWSISGLPAGSWSVQARGNAQYGTALTEIETVTVPASNSTSVTLTFESMAAEPPWSVLFPWTTTPGLEWIRITMLGNQYTLDEVEDTWLVKGYGAMAQEREVAKSGSGGAQKRRAAKRTSGGQKAEFIDPVVGAKAKPSGTDTQIDVLDKGLGDVKNGNLVKLTPLPEDVEAWLAEWKAWIVSTERNTAIRKAIQKTTPELYLPKGKTLPQLALLPGPPNQVEVWAVFGPARMPAYVTRERYRTAVPYVPKDVRDAFEVLKKEDLYEWRGIEEMASVPLEFYEEIIVLPKGDPAPFFDALDERAFQVKENLEFLGMDPAVVEAMGGSLTVLANSDVTALQGLGLSSFAAILLLDSARSVVPESAWSMATSELAGAETAATKGYDSYGAVAGAPTETLASDLGITMEEATALKADAQGRYTRGAVEELAAGVQRAAAAEVTTEAFELNLSNFTEASAPSGISSNVVAAGRQASTRLGQVLGVVSKQLGTETLEVDTTVALGGFR